MKKIFRILLLFFVIICFNLFSDNKFLDNGIKFFNSKDYSKAIPSLQKALKEEPANFQIHYYLGTSFYHQKQYKDAVFYLSEYLLNIELKNINMYREVLNNSFYSHRTYREWEKIIDLGKKLLERIKEDKSFNRLETNINNNISSAYAGLGQQSLNAKNYEEAKKYYTESITYNPKNFYLFDRLGVSNFFLDLYEEAEENFIIHLKNQTKNWRTISSSAYYLSRIKTDTSKLSSELQNQNLLGANILKIYNFLYKEDYDKGFELAFKVEEEGKTNGNITMHIINQIQNEVPAPEQLFIKYIKYFSPSNQVNWTIQRILRIVRGSEKQEKIKKELVETLDNVITSKIPQDKKPEYEKLLLDVKYFNPPEETEEFLKEKIKDFYSVASKYVNTETSKNLLLEIATIYSYKLGEDEKAIEILLPLVEKGNYKNADMELAKIYTKQKDYLKALSLLEKTILQQPKNEPAKMMLAESFLNLGSYDKGIQILKELESSTKNTNIKTDISNMLSEYREIPLKENLKNDIFVFITEREEYLSPSINLDSKSSVIKQNIWSANIFPVSPKRTFSNITLEMVSETKPSLVEPYVIYKTTTDNKYITRWQQEIATSSDKWRPIRPFNVLYPWEENIPEGVTVVRRNFFEDSKFILEIEVSLPSTGWEIKIIDSTYSRRRTNISPTPDYSNNSFVLYNNKENFIKIKLEYLQRTDIINYHPEMFITKKTVSNDEILKPKNQIVKSNEIKLETKGEVNNFIILREITKNINLSETLIRR